jgi:hypothetical protein
MRAAIVLLGRRRGIAATIDPPSHAERDRAMLDNLTAQPQTGQATSGPDSPAFAASLTAAASTAVSEAVARAHAAGFAVPGMIDGKAVEYRPDGKVMPVADLTAWSPTDWKTHD